MIEQALAPFVGPDRRLAFNGPIQASNARQAQWLPSSSAVAQRDMADRLRRASGDNEHSLLYLRFQGLETAQLDTLHRAIEQVSKRLWGRVLLVPLSSMELVLFLEDWSGFRSLQLRSLLELAVRRAIGEVAGSVSMRVGLAAFRGPAELSELLDCARNDCECPHSGY